MILTCPKCETRFALPAQALAPAGKNVKCSNCGNTWFQEPDTDELIEDLENVPSEDLEEVFEDIVENLAEEEAAAEAEDILEREEINPEDIGFGDIKEEEGGDNDQLNVADEAALEDGKDPEQEEEISDIPDAVKPLPAKKSAKLSETKNPKSLVVAMASGLVFAAMLILPALAYKDGIIQSWPQSMAFYNKLGLKPTIPGDGIVFDKMRSKITGKVLEVSGQVINLTSTTKALPLIEITLKDKNGEAFKHFYINEDAKKLVSETTMPIAAKFDLSESEAKAAHDTSIQFVIQKKN